MTDIVGELKGFAHCCGASKAGNGAFRVVSLTGSGSEETEQNLRAVLREAAALIASQAARIRELEEKLSCIPSIIYRVPSYVVGGFDRDDSGVVLPGSPYDRGRYDARKAVEEACRSLLSRKGGE